MITVAIGDVHGCLEHLKRLLVKCRGYANGRACKIIFLGDLIDRGPDSRDVVDLVMRMDREDPENVVCLAGNHEALLGSR